MFKRGGAEANDHLALVQAYQAVETGLGGQGGDTGCVFRSADEQFANVQSYQLLPAVLGGIDRLLVGELNTPGLRIEYQGRLGQRIKQGFQLAAARNAGQPWNST